MNDQNSLENIIIIYTLFGRMIMDRKDYDKILEDSFKTIEIYPRTDCTLWE